MVVGGRELIDTLWNVNRTVPKCNRKSIRELIDTLWNVNHVSAADTGAFNGINRYIMECKCGQAW